jgi:hypothetical protein
MEFISPDITLFPILVFGIQTSSSWRLRGGLVDEFLDCGGLVDEFLDCV